MDNEIVITKSLTKIYLPSGAGIRNIDFFVYRGEIVGYVGPNGSGKSTTIKVLATFIRPTRGTAIINGWDIQQEQQKIRNFIGVAPQDYFIDWTLTLLDNLDIFARLYGMKKNERMKRINDLLEIFQLYDKRATKAVELSGGELRRLQFIRILLKPADLLFVDEPTLELDPIGKETVLEFIKKLKASGKTIFLATNEMREAEEICDRVIFLKKGKIIKEGKVKDIIEEYGDTNIIKIELSQPADDLSLDKLNDILLDKKDNVLVFKGSERDIPLIANRLINIGIIIGDIKLEHGSLTRAFFNLSREKVEQ